MSYYLPFNHRPATSVTVYTDTDGEQTIAANTYARVVANVNDGGSFNINGTAVLTTLVAYLSYNDSAGVGALLTMTGRSGIITTQGATLLIYVNGVATSAATLTAGNEYIINGSDVLYKSDAASSVTYQLRYTDGFYLPVSQEYWLDAGDTCEINGNGGMSIEVYPVT